jgi:hypothetical protein
MHASESSSRTVKKAKLDIVAAFHLTGRRIFTYSDLERILAQNRQQWRLPASMSVHAFLEFLVHSNIIAIDEIKFPSRTYVRYTRGQVPIYALLLSLHQRSYFTHRTAMYLHKICEQGEDAFTSTLNSDQSSRTALLI